MDREEVLRVYWRSEPGEDGRGFHGDMMENDLGLGIYPGLVAFLREVADGLDTYFNEHLEKELKALCDNS
jgi:hypothetical protein